MPPVVVVTMTPRWTKAVVGQSCMETTMKPCPVYTLEEASRLLQVKPITIRRLIARKKLSRVPFIRHIRVPCASLDRLANGGAPS